ncbi:LLM class flavin-dependent oxidoreductase [Streptomonospora sp. S1-112]|uniref:LLM class flavin-dependent oxidoreductase n=1 Tax=Streptomonospora mangrovi TaxID=2883123 RepID=A0A9X3SFC0_9ACTN|nr:LLM class flavin-dependent oxidoreductase [Streptomonospora mangrovi]MDA0562784.1 LLM class flavin-dependent oxidoreductase [Streptomonospora mangrovi]
MNRLRLGFQIPCRLPASRIAALARRVEEAGFDELWLVEDCFFAGGIAASATALAATERIGVGIGILPAVARNAAFTAMEVAALAEAHPGRFTAGLGHGMRDWMRQIGAAPASPLTALAEHLDAVRRLLAGETVTTQGRYVRLDGVRLEFPPEPPPPVVAGVRGPRSLEVSGRHADGTVLAEPVTPAYLASARASIARGRVGRESPHTITAYTLFHADDDLGRARDALRPALAGPVADPAWAAHLADVDLGPRRAAVAALPPAERAAALPADWIDCLSACGPPERCLERVRETGAAGADTVVLCPVGDTDEQLARAAALPALLAR